MEGLGIFGVILFFVLLLLAVLWCILPFAVFGIKDRIAQLSGAVHRSNELHQQILAELKANREEMARQLNTSRLAMHDAVGKLGDQVKSAG